MERAHHLLVIAVSSLLILSSVEATRPVMSPAWNDPTMADPTIASGPDGKGSNLPGMPPTSQTQYSFVIDDYMKKGSLKAELAVDALDMLTYGGSPKTEEQNTWITDCRSDYMSAFDTFNTANAWFEENDFGTLSDNLARELHRLDRCAKTYNERAGGHDNPAKIYENEIRDIIQKTISLIKFTTP